MRTKRISLLLFLTIIITSISFSQNKTFKRSSVYDVKRAIEVPATIGLFTFNYFGFSWINNKSRLTTSEINNLDANNIWAFDRWVTEQDPAFMNEAHNISDIGLNVTLALPLLFVFDKKIRNEWLDILILYGESQALTSTFYVLTTTTVDRIRPLAYNPEVDMSMKQATGTKISFYSGHVSSTAAASFFMAKVYSDYHPELGNKKYWLFAAAIIPPAFVGFYRIKAMKHFPTDVITGMVTGAAVGILTPHFHKLRKKNNNLSIVPFTGEYTGVFAKLNF